MQRYLWQINQSTTNPAHSSLYLAEHRHHRAACWAGTMGVPYGNPWGGQMGGTTVSLHSSVTTPRTYGLRYPVYMCSPLHAIPNPLVWWKYMCNNNELHPPHPRLLLLLSRQSSSFNACNRGPPAHNQPILWGPSCWAIDCIVIYNMVAVQIHNSSRRTTNTRPHTHATPNVEHDHG